MKFVVSSMELVITSYSIHYTKLYDPRRFSGIQPEAGTFRFGTGSEGVLLHIPQGVGMEGEKGTATEKPDRPPVCQVDHRDQHKCCCYES